MAVNLILYQNTAESNVVDKTDYLTSVGTLSGVLRDGTSIVDMALTIEATELPNFNYVHISAFNRYYFVTDIVSVRTNLWEISLHTDVLMSYRTAIKNCTGFIDRNENTFNQLVIDPEIPLRQGEQVSQYTIDNDVFVDSSSIGQYLITGIGLQPSNDV